MKPRPLFILSNCCWFMFRSNQPATRFSAYYGRGERPSYPEAPSLFRCSVERVPRLLDGRVGPLGLASGNHGVGHHLGAALGTARRLEEPTSHTTHDDDPL